MILGLDLSLTGTGIALLTRDPVNLLVYPFEVQPYEGQRLYTACLDKPPVGVGPFPRWNFIVAGIMAAAQFADTIVIEGYSFASGGRATFSIGELGGIVRYALLRNGHSYIEVPPTVLKRFVCNSGAAPKNVMLLEAYKRFGISFKSDDICDAFCLAMIGKALRNGHGDLPKFQQEVIEGILNPKRKVKKAKHAS